MITFEKISEHPITTLQYLVEEYVESSSGARHIHLSNDQSDLAFLVAFPTVPDSSDGRAHILEHLALCGSQRYPVRDPFFAMMRRSTASFMNAMTYADRTVYPFASTDRTDFFNLLDVYLDATFFPRLDYLSFRQEGWRHVLLAGQLRYQGVVLNEMKGSFADPTRAIYIGITSELLAGTTYAVVSGGDPLVIPELTHQALLEFHARHYHPSQALFMSAGRIPAKEIQQQIIDRVLSRLPGKQQRIVPGLAQVDGPRKTTIHVPSQTARADEFGIQLAWLRGEAADTNAYYHTSLLQSGLFGDASTPLRQVTESGGYGRPSRLNGMDPSARQMLFHVGMEGLTEEQTQAARKRIWDALERTAEQGVPVASLRAALRDISYAQRDTASGNMPNVLTRMLRAVPAAMRGGAVIDAFDSSMALKELAEEATAPDFFQRLVRGLLDSPARLDSLIVPDNTYFSARDSGEQSRLAATLAAMDNDERQRIVAENEALEAQQRRTPKTHLLPRIAPADVSAHPRALPAIAETDNRKYVFDIASNGLSYARLQFDVSAFPQQDWPWLQLYADLRRDLGVGDQDFQSADVWRRGMVPSFMVSLEAVLRTDAAIRPALVYFASGLREEHANMAAVLQKYVECPRFDEHPRLAFLIRRMVRNRVNSLAQSGDRLAALAAAAPLSPLSAFENHTGGVKQLSFYGELERLAASEPGLGQISARLADLHARIATLPATVLCAGSGDAQALADLIMLRPVTSTPHDAPVQAPAGPRANHALYATAQVNHCNIAWQAPQQDHPHAPCLAVAAELLSNHLLHPALRERGGAYGGGATYNGAAGTFSMNSFRDPRLAGTYADFALSLDQLIAADFTDEQVEEAIICVIKKLDRPTSPFDAVTSAWRLAQRGIDLNSRQLYRTRVRHCTAAEVRVAVQRWLKDAEPSRAAFVGNTTQDMANLTVTGLLALVNPIYDNATGK